MIEALMLFTPYQKVSVFFGILATFGVIVGIVYKVTILYSAYIAKKKQKLIDIELKLNELELVISGLNQRQVFQSEFMSYQEKRYNRSQAIIQRYAIDTAEIKASIGRPLKAQS